MAGLIEAFNSVFGSTIDTSTLLSISVPSAFLAGILSIIGGAMGKRKDCVILIIGGILAFIATSLFGILPCISATPTGSNSVHEK